MGASQMRRAAALLCVALSIALAGASSPGVASADTYSDYQENVATLDQLVDDRGAALGALRRASASEQDVMTLLTDAESKLHTALVERTELTADQPLAAQRVQDAGDRAQSQASEQARLEREKQAFEMWLYDFAPLPQLRNVRAYQRAVLDLDTATVASEAAAHRLSEEQERQAAEVDRLGALNSEVTRWQSEAETLAGRVGIARASALEASSRLADLQKQGDELNTLVQAQFGVLRAAGYPVGVGKIAADGGPPPIVEPSAWSSQAVGYALPMGRVDSSLASGPPLFVNKERLAATGALDSIGAWTAPLRGPITTPFGDATPYQAAHYATDIGARLYSPVVVTADGTVEFAGLAASDNRLASYGLVVVIRHNEHVTSLYAHLDDRANGLLVTPRQAVQAGQVIGYVGLSGYSTGPHLHFEVRVDNQPVDPELLVNPLPGAPS